jgi:hypothetical protein
MDDLPILSLARMVRESARGIALRDEGRAVGVAFKSDGSIFASDCIVRFDIADSEDPARRLADAFAALGARSIWFYGGDHAARRAASDLNLAFAPTGAAFVHYAESKIDRRDVVLRPPSALDRISINEIAKEYGRGFATPEVLLAQRGDEVVGVVMSEPLDGHWTEVRGFVYPAQRGRGHGAATRVRRNRDTRGSRSQRARACGISVSGLLLPSQTQLARERSGYSDLSEGAYCATPPPNDQFSPGISTSVINTSSARTLAFRQSCVAMRW